ncbi:MFS transporter [Nocardia seriolae]|uniref:MFS transporter n=1 Tax=Nocardia seriolae TaxID=37332 RepID=UPI00068A3894|nr:MFS transporter [Nocardia seriolae]MTJ63219.1 MFS transporter [Nocardia seriolae]MTJ72157.1 MFS transporter [Nocardia seriolae]MTJ88978.1 MFS transporter [Nocardia seriolae]MTK32958.1 MFS transporter [Nocardia seriolae]MTK41112.1 MFS transporter [Nocardia seriolae]
MTAIETVEPVLKRRWLVALFLGAAAMSLTMVTASTMGTLVAADELGPAWSGLPSAAGVLGTALGASGLTTVMERRGRRAGVMSGYAVGVAGGLCMVLSTMTVWLLIAGMVLLGVGNAAAQLSRYAAADLRPGRPGALLAVVVWAGTVGAVGGPLLLAPLSVAAQAVDRPAQTAVFLLGAVSVAIAALTATTLRRDTSTVPPDRPPQRPPMRLALISMLTAQVVMTTIMTAAPLAIHQHGHGLHVVGTMISAHTFGMFALAPLSGLLCDRFGGRPLIVTGLALLAISATAATVAGTVGGPLLALVLFLLGYAWNLAHIGASNLLAGNLPETERMHVQGAVESRVWGGSALATMVSTAGYAIGGYGLLAALSLTMLTIPAALLFRERPTGSREPMGRRAFRRSASDHSA